MSRDRRGGILSHCYAADPMLIIFPLNLKGSVDYKLAVFGNFNSY